MKKIPTGYSEFETCILPLKTLHGWINLSWTDNGWTYVRFADGHTVKLDSVLIDNETHFGHVYAVIEVVTNVTPKA